MISRMLRGSYDTPNRLFWCCVEACVDFYALCLLIRGTRRRETGVTCANENRLNGVRKRFNSITLLAYPRSYMILTELMWSMYSVAMFLCCALSCFGMVFQPFEYGVIRLFALPRLKKPPDLVSEGGTVRCANVNNYDSRYDYYIMRQQFLLKVLSKQHMRRSHETPILENIRRAPCTADEEDIPLDEAAQQAPMPSDADPVVLLTREKRIYDQLKSFSWMAGESTRLNNESASVLRTILDVPICLASAMIAIIFDTGASMSISGEEKDFPYGVEKCSIKLQGIGSGILVTGKGIIRWSFPKLGGGVITVECMGYYAPEMKFRLFSPQSYFVAQQKEGKFVMDKDGVVFELSPTDRVKIVLNAANLPVALATSNVEVASDKLALLTCATDARNVQLPMKAKRLLQWHYRLGHCSLKLVRWLASKGYIRGSVDVSSDILCDSCRLCRTNRRAVDFEPGSRSCKNEKANLIPTVKRQLNSIKGGDLHPGDCVSIDQYVSSHKGRLATGYGKTASHLTYGGGTIFVDHASGFTHVEHQVSLSAGDTIRAKRNFERILYHHGVIVKKYRADNGVFNSAAFEAEIEKGSQSITYSGVGAQHQNGVAERAIRTVVERARTMLIHAAMRNQEHVDVQFWPFAMTHSCHLWNTVPKLNQFSPVELLSRTLHTRNYSDLRHCHVWGCPVYILEYDIAVGKKVPKWSPRARRGVYLGVSAAHSSNVPLVYTIKTGSITPQYHIVFDDCFSTVVAEAEEPQVWNQLFTYTNQSWDQFNEDDDVTEPSRFERESLEQQRMQTRNAKQKLENGSKPTKSGVKEGSTAPAGISDEVKEGSLTPNIDMEFGNDDGVGDGNGVGDFDGKEGSMAPTRGDIDGEEGNNTPTYEGDGDGDGDGVRISRRQRKSPDRLSYSRFGGMAGQWDFKKAHANLCNLNYEFLSSPTTILAAFYQRFQRLNFDSSTDTIEDELPISLMVRAQEKDDLTWAEARVSHEYERFREAALSEIESLEEKGSWEVVSRSSVKGKHILPSTWALKRKRYPDGRIRKYKARFCVRGDRQRFGIDFDETYAPVVQWSSVRMLFTLALTLGLKTRQVDYSNAFVQADIDGEVYCELPQEFLGPDNDQYVLKLKKSLYGLKQAPRLWFKTLEKSLHDRGFHSSENDPCLFLKKGLVALVYVDDVLFFGKSDAIIDEMIANLKRDFDLKVEGTVDAFLGVEVLEHKKGRLARQSGLTERVISAVDMVDANSVKTPALTMGLGADVGGAPRKESWSYPSVVGMLLYLAGNTRPDIAFAVHQCARFSHRPMKCHEDAVKRIVRYLIGTKEKGLLFAPRKDIVLEAYADADFAGLWNVEDPQDPTCAKSRTGYVIQLGGAPVVWKSKLQTLVAVSTMEAEYIALSMCMRELIPLRRLLKELQVAFNFESSIARTASTVFEDNMGALTLANVPKLTPRSKHIAIPYHFFREFVRKKEVAVVHVSTDNQLADLLTKGLVQVKFESLREKLMGW